MFLKQQDNPSMIIDEWSLISAPSLLPPITYFLPCSHRTVKGKVLKISSQQNKMKTWDDIWNKIGLSCGKLRSSQIVWYSDDCIHLYSHAFTCTYLYSFPYLHSFAFTCIPLHSLAFTCIPLYSLTFTYMHLHSLSFTFIVTPHNCPAQQL